MTAGSPHHRPVSRRAKGPSILALLALLAVLALLGPAGSLDSTHVTIDLDRVRSPHFQGLGYALDPFLWLPVNRAAGFEEQDWDIVRRRVASNRPGWVSMGVSTGWFHPAPGVFRWDTPEMRALYRYLDLCQELGISVQLVLEWFQAYQSVGWYTDARAGWLPHDPEVAAQAYVRLLTHLWGQRGYTIVRAMTIGQEPSPNLGAQLVALYRTTDRQLRKAGLRQRVLLTGPNAQSPGSDLLPLFDQQLIEELDALTVHYYRPHVQRHITEHHIPPVTGLPARFDRRYPVWLTEFGWPSITDYYTGVRIAAWVAQSLNAGIEALLYWTGHAAIRPSVDEQPDTLYSLWLYRDRAWQPKPF